MSQQLTFNLNVDNKQAIDSINTFFDAFDAGVKGVGAKMDEQFKQKNVKIEMRLEGGKLVAKEVNNAASAGNKLEKAMKVVNGKFGQTAKEVNNSVALLKVLVATTNKYKEGTKELSEDWKKLVQLLREARKEAKDFEVPDQAQRSITGANIAAGLALDAIRGLVAGVRSLINEGIQMEVLMIQLKGFTGSAEAAEAAFDEFLKIAAATPFNVTQVAEGARTMMGFGLSTAEATNRIEQLAIVASATGGELTHMARNLGQIQANQRAYTRDLMQFANQGIPIYQMLAEVLGMTTQQVRELAEEGQIGFNEVGAALDKMTEKGSAFRKIAEEMDRTIAARLEALQGTISATAGKFIQMVQAIDAAAGGPIEKTFAVLIFAVQKVGKFFDYLRDKAEGLAPIFVALGTAIAGAIGIALVQNLALIIWHFKLWFAQIMKTKFAVLALSAAQAVLNALTGNVAALALAAGVATAGFLAYKVATHEASDETEKLNEEMRKEEFSTAADSANQLAFRLEGLTDRYKLLVKEEKKRYDEAKKGHDLAVSQMERALAFVKLQDEERKTAHKAEIERIKDKIETEKQGMKEALQAAKSAHATKMDDLKAELQAVRDRYDEELAELDKQSSYSKELEQIRRKEIQNKLNSSGLSRKETLELKEQLHQMDVRAKRRELLARKAKEEKEVQDEITAAEEKHKNTLDAINKGYGSRIEAQEQALAAEQSAIDAIDAKYKEQAAKIRRFKAEELAAIYKNRDEAIKAIDDQIIKARNFKKTMKEAYGEAKRLNIKDRNDLRVKESSSAPGSGRLSARASGGPVAGGSTYQVNELGKEAFLSAAGKLSMINAPSFGHWKAPTSGTVIPAHLTKQLDIPSGGINLDRSAGQVAMRRGTVGDAMSAIKAGDNIVNNVTIQSSNTRQQAMDTMVQLARLKRARYS